jgi:hypothetical protein
MMFYQPLEITDSIWVEFIIRTRLTASKMLLVSDAILCHYELR